MSKRQLLLVSKITQVDQVDLRFSLPHDDLVPASFADAVEEAVLLSPCHCAHQHLGQHHATPVTMGNQGSHVLAAMKGHKVP